MPGARQRVTLAIAAAAVVAVAGCATSTGPTAELPRSSTTTGTTTRHQATTKPAAPVVPLRKGERFLDLAMPAAYTPKAPTATGHDDYRCFLLDPNLAKRALVEGVDIVPGNPKVVHHVIVFKVQRDWVGRAKAADAASPGPGWTCFGDAGIGRGGQGNSLDSAPWIGAWAPGGGERVLPRGVGIPLDPGTQIVMQVHYNLLAGPGPDVSRARLRVAAPGPGAKALETMLLPAPVELPCRPEVKGALCDRTAAVADIRARFDERVAQADLLHLLCGAVKPGPVQSCTRKISETGTIRAVAGHMHLLGRSITITVNAGMSDAKTILNIPVWDFDDQGSRALATPVTVTPGDTVTVTCHHDQAIRDKLPAFDGQAERYVAWGEGTTDEMCLGIVLYTRG